MAKQGDYQGLVKHLNLLLKQKRLIPFIGAGFSKNCPRKGREPFPTWSELVDYLFKKFGIEPTSMAYKYGLMRVVEYLSLVKGGMGPIRYELERLSDDESAQISESRPHLLLAQMDVPVIYTTNWDNLIEKAYEHLGKRYEKVVGIQDIIRVSRSADNPTQIIKFHGSFEYEESLILTERQYFERLELDSPLDLKLRADILGRSILFIGYSFGDINIRYLWFKVNRLMHNLRHDDRPISYIVLAERDPIAEKLFPELGIESIILDDIPYVADTSCETVSGRLSTFLASIIDPNLLSSQHG